MLGHRFSVVTTLSRSIAAIETNLMKYGLAGRCAKVRASEVPVLALDEPSSNAVAQISVEIELAKLEDRAEAIVLGCAGMADLAAHLTEKHGLPVIDGVASAVKLAEAFGALGLKTSKVGSYAAPRPKPYLGSFAPFAPR
jgi:allantoin racemase